MVLVKNEYLIDINVTKEIYSRTKKWSIKERKIVYEKF